MSEKDEYTIISVKADDEDEVVIQAGIPSEYHEDDPEEFFEESPEYELGEEEVEDILPPSQPETVAEPQYHEITQEELDSVAPMSNVQKAILVLALIGVVAIVIYIVFSMR